MKLSNYNQIIVRFLILTSCIHIAACQHKEATDVIDRDRYPERTPKPLPQTIEKADIEDEFFEGEKVNRH